MLAFHSDETDVSLPAGSRFPAARFRLLRETVARELPAVRLRPAAAATRAALCLAHDAAYVDAVLAGRLSAAQQREIGFVQTPQTVLRARRSVGATLMAMQAALREGVAANLAGGSHHARADGGAGYCVFNDVAVAARWFQQQTGRAEPVAVIDLDVHQGNGTAAIFRGDASVFTLSVHGQRNYPFRKEPGSLDIELPDGCGDADYLAALDQALHTLWQRTAARPPCLVFYLAGADPHEGDRLGRLRLTDEGLGERDRRVLHAVRERGIPLVLTMAGGYGEDLHHMVALQTHTVRLAWQSWETGQTSSGVQMGQMQEKGRTRGPPSLGEGEAPACAVPPAMYADVSLAGATEGEPA